MKIFLLLVLIMALVGIAGSVVAQVSANYDLSWHVLSGGGGMHSSVDYSIRDALSQTASIESSSANNVVKAGFLMGVTGVQRARVFLPVVNR